ncbi:uncharacterized protein M6B38_345865 [Iris pallida]|uniref:Uncharacterized protein n=1 Tax=Iris pallida TaxID=29817 RepID=A0AAX6GUC7_IRIPA|nr:uncharacterized protein M6B38_345865 [Iris pallida]
MCSHMRFGQPVCQSQRGNFSLSFFLMEPGQNKQSIHCSQGRTITSEILLLNGLLHFPLVIFILTMFYGKSGK